MPYFNLSKNYINLKIPHIKWTLSITLTQCFFCLILWFVNQIIDSIFCPLIRKNYLDGNRQIP